MPPETHSPAIAPQAPAAPHLAPSRQPALRPSPEALDALPDAKRKLWRPKQILITKAARGSRVAERAAARGAELGAEVRELGGNQVRGLSQGTEREAYRRAKGTLIIAEAPASKLRFQPIPPSADFRLDLAVGCPAHCQYCYLAGSLKGPPATRAYSNLDAIFAAVPGFLGEGRITSGTDARGHEGTTFEASCYTDPLGIEHLTGSLGEAIEFMARLDAGEGQDLLQGAAPQRAGLRFTTKYDAVAPLLALDHRGRTRARFSVNAEIVTRRFEGGTAPLGARLRAMGEMARAGYPVGLTVAPIMPVEDWEGAYDRLLEDAAAALPEGADLTLELITHRFTPGSREVLSGWYPGSTLEMDPAVRKEKRTKFGSVKYVYPASLMREMRESLEASAARHLPGARLLYWT